MLFDVLDDMATKDSHAKDTFGDEFSESKLGSRIYKMFMAEVGSEVCQAEVAHHANKCPEFFCSRVPKHVHVYKAMLAIDTKKHGASASATPCNEVMDAAGTFTGITGDVWDECADDDEVIKNENSCPSANNAKKRSATKPSDLELYERRTSLWFPHDTAQSPRLPQASTPEQQVANASMYDFYRLVQYHGGKQPYITWHASDVMPIVIMSPVLKLREGGDFAFGSRWCLVQYHAWTDRRLFIDMSDAEVVIFFRTWVESAACPWYITQQYHSENTARIAGVKSSESQRKVASDALDEAVIDDALDAVPMLEAESDEESEDVPVPKDDDDTRVFKMLYKGNLQEVNRLKEQTRKSVFVNKKHNVYKNQRVTGIEQEESSALPAGVTNVNEDDDDELQYGGDSKEIKFEADELRAAAQWVNQAGALASCVFNSNAQCHSGCSAFAA